MVADETVSDWPGVLVTDASGNFDLKVPRAVGDGVFQPKHRHQLPRGKTCPIPLDQPKDLYQFRHLVSHCTPLSPMHGGA